MSEVAASLFPSGRWALQASTVVDGAAERDELRLVFAEGSVRGDGSTSRIEGVYDEGRAIVRFSRQSSESEALQHFAGVADRDLIYGLFRQAIAAEAAEALVYGSFRMWPVGD